MSRDGCALTRLAIKVRDFFVIILTTLSSKNMGAKIITLLVTLTILSKALGDVRFFPDRIQTPYQRRYPTSRGFLPVITEIQETNRNLLETTNYTAPPVTMRLKGSTDLGYYYVTLFFGTPIQKQTLIVDTGSMTTTIPCSGKHKPNDLV